jgi:lysozyme
MLSAIHEQDYEEAAKQMLDSKWAKQVKGRANELASMMKSDILHI